MGPARRRRCGPRRQCHPVRLADGEEAGPERSMTHWASKRLESTHGVATPLGRPGLTQTQWMLDITPRLRRRIDADFPRHADMVVDRLHSLDLLVTESRQDPE